MLAVGFLMSLLLFATLITAVIPRYAIAASNSIIINEVELNPLGNDNLSNDNVREQIELYNPTAATIDVGGWSAQTTAGIQETILIPMGTMILPGGYLLVGRDPQWLDNTAETVVLKNANGVQIDSFGPKDDPDNDAKSWQRFPNGADALSFSQNTLGVSNGGVTTFPIIHMSDTTVSFASLVSAPRQLLGEFVAPTSQLVGDKIDSITLRLQRVGAPTGFAQIGIFNADLSVKKLFGTKDVATIGTTATDFEFKLPGTDPLYAIASGDRIGIKYIGGSGSAGINVTPDRATTDPFDGTNSYRVRYEAGWITSTGEDMYMILKQTHADSSPGFPITHMSDTTVSFASLVSAPRQLIVEYVTPTSQLVGDKIDSITLRLQRVGAPTGTAQIGIFNPDLSVKKLFGTIDVSTISTTATEYGFKLLAADPLYVIASGDRIGIKYTGGSGSVGINVTPDRDTADPFDGNNSYRARYEAAWIISTSEDLYMILKQTHG